MRKLSFLIASIIILFSCEKSKSEEILLYPEIDTELEKFIEKYAVDSNFVIGHASDIHAYRENWNENLVEFFSLFNKWQMLINVNALFLTGDYCEGTSARDKINSIKEIKSVFDVVLNQNIPCYAVIGNHDDNIDMARGRIRYEGDNYIKKHEQVELIISPLLEKWHPSENSGHGYYKIDFESHKIRVLFLDFVDYTEETAEDGSMLHNLGYMFSQSQLEWMYETLLSTPEDYSVMFVSHGIYNTHQAIGEYAQGADLIPDIVNAYKNSLSFKHNWKHPTITNNSTQLNFDFSKRSKGKFICYLNGHIHTRAIIPVDKYPDQIMITAPCLYSNATTTSSINLPLLNRDNADEKNSFNIIIIDTSSESIYLFCYGAYYNEPLGIEDRVIKIKYN